MLFWVAMACESAGTPAAPAGSAPTTAGVVAAGPRPDVVLITLDTTRADRLGAYGHSLARTDALDALAARGLRFDHAYSVLPLTIPAHSSIFTGLYPYHHQVRDNGGGVLADSHTTLAELFQGAGYATAGSAAAFVTTRQWGFAQGFDAYFDQMPARVDQGKTAANYWHSERPGELVVNDALAWLGTVPADKPVFLWVHLYDAHFPYLPGDAYARLVPGRPYDAELAYVDDQVGRVVEAFAGRDAVFAVIGDHGESLGEHDESEHGLYTYDSTQRVPFILAGPGVKPGVVADPVSAVDVLPTLLSLAGLPVPAGVDGAVQPGSKVTPYAESYQMVDRLRIAPHRMIADGPLKLIAKPKPELYDVVADPRELSNLAEQRPDEVKRLQALLEAKNATPPGQGAALDAATIAQLEALGYVAGANGAVDPFALPDPLDYPELLRGVGMLDRKDSKDPERALAKVTRLLELKADAYELRMRKASLLQRLERGEEAEAFMEETARLFPDSARPFVMLAGSASRQGDLSAALRYAGRALDLDPRDRAAREISVDAQLRSGLEEDAIAAGTVWFEDDPGNLGLASVLGRYWMARGDFTRAEHYLRLAASGANPELGARVALAALAAGTGRTSEAISLLEDELGDRPDSVEALRALARILGDERDYQAQLDLMRRLVRLQPASPEARLALAQCQFNLPDFAAARITLEEAKALAPDDPDIMLLDANLLAKEGKREEGHALFLKAEAAHRERLAAQGKAPPPPSAARTPASGGGANVIAAPEPTP